MCDFIETGLYQGHIIVEFFDFFSEKLFHKIACEECLFV